MPDEASRRWMTYAEIAAVLGLPSAKAGEAKARRARWERVIGNDGFARVAVPLSALEDTYPHRRPRAKGVHSPAAPAAEGRKPVEGPAQALQATLLAEALLRAENQVAALAAEVAELRERTGRAEAEALVRREAEREARARSQAALQALETTRTELAAWTAGGPLARALRAFLNRRGRP